MGGRSFNAVQIRRMMNSSELVGKIQELSDLELAILLSLVAGEHCLIETEHEALDSTCQELQLVSNACAPYAVAQSCVDRL